MFTFSHRKDLLYPGWKSCICLTYPSTPTDSTCRFFFALHTTYLTQRHIKKHSGWRACQELMLKGYLQCPSLNEGPAAIFYVLGVRIDWILTFETFCIVHIKIIKKYCQKQQDFESGFLQHRFFFTKLSWEMIWYSTRSGHGLPCPLILEYISAVSHVILIVPE